jgi:membrane associated rhomboid family serine protease
MSSALARECLAVGGYPRMTMSETELSVICKNCGSEVSPYVTECPYCGTRLRKRAPKLERRGDALEAKPRRRRRLRIPRRRQREAVTAFRPYATMGAILISAGLLLVLKATGSGIDAYGGLIVPLDDQWWRFFTAPFAYTDLERRLGMAPTSVLLLACGALGMLVASGIANGQGDIEVIAGGNGMALGAVAAWFAIRRAEAHHAIDDDYDAVGVIVAAAVLLALPIFESSADPFAGLIGAAVGGLAGLAASALRDSH